MAHDLSSKVDEAIAKHESDPAYEVHLGGVVDITGSAHRVVSIWLEGVRWSGYLKQADPRELEPPPSAG